MGTSSLKMHQREPGSSLMDPGTGWPRKSKYAMDKLIQIHRYTLYNNVYILYILNLNRFIVRTRNHLFGDLVKPSVASSVAACVLCGLN